MYVNIYLYMYIYEFYRCFKCQQEIPVDCHTRLNTIVDHAKMHYTKLTDISTNDTGQSNPPIPLKMVEIVDINPSDDAFNNSNNKQMEFTRQNKTAVLNGKKKKVLQQLSGACEVSVSYFDLIF